MGLEEWPKTGAAVMKGKTFHARRGGPDNTFRYDVDYLLLRMRPRFTVCPFPLRRGRVGLLALSDRDHGQGKAPMEDWAITHARGFGLPEEAMAEVWLLTQPRTLGYVFNPVSFWFFRDGSGAVRAVLAEVNNTFGDRHGYFCALANYRPIGPRDTIKAQKVFHVSPFQEIAGGYAFRFTLEPDRLDIHIDHRRTGSDGKSHGVVATLSGKLTPMSTRAILAMIARHPFGAFRVSALIYWQALRLKLKGARYRVRPVPPTEEVTR